MTLAGVVARTDEVPLDPLSVSPGVLGFGATFLLALVLWLLLRNMTGRLRGVKRRGLEAEAAERARAERARAEGVVDGRAGPGATGSSAGPDPASDRPSPRG